MNIVSVTSYFDEERTQPANYVVQLRDGLFEARVFDESESSSERVIGIFVNQKAALRALYHHGQAWIESILGRLS